MTLSGVDESVAAHELAAISRRYPFVEWGVLCSESREGKSPRYPSRRWREILWREADRKNMLISAHLCGALALEPDADLLKRYNRIQLNGISDWRAIRGFIAEAEGAYERAPRRIIGQARDLDMLRQFLHKDVISLYDVSGGTGTQPMAWPYSAAGQQLLGFAGGIGLDNVELLLEQAQLHAHDATFWIDMESSLRTDSGARFDLSKAEAILRLAERFVSAHSIYL